MEDLDTPRVVAGSADEILRALERYALTWDGEVVFQSQRLALYEAALNELRAKDRVFDCACSRADLQRAASAPLGAEPVYPGTCRNGLPGRAARRSVPRRRVSLRDCSRRIDETLRARRLRGQARRRRLRLSARGRRR